MMDNGLNWRNRELRQHIKVIDGLEAPTLILTNATYLNVYTKQWLKANIWIFNERIVYVGDKLPEQTDQAELVDCSGKYLVPGYIEPHSHPFQLSNPEEIALTAARYGTTTLINDNLPWNFLLDKKKAFSILDEFNNLPVSMYWWARFDSQTALHDEEKYFNTIDVLSWLSHPSVVQGGELTGWPSLLDGNDRLLYWIQEAKRLGKPVEGHLPGASPKTLTKMKLLGVSADHESMTGEDVMTRLQMGYHVGLRYSSIRPDLPKLIEEILEAGLETFDNLTMTMDGPSLEFMEKGMMNVCLEIAIEKGIPLIEAYRMASYNAARHFRLDEQLGSIAPGRVAHINILKDKTNPHPESVLAKGQWIVKEAKNKEYQSKIDWKRFDIGSLKFDWELDEGDLQFSAPVGMEMVNNVIVKPYTIDTDIAVEDLTKTNGDQFLLLIDRNGKWRVNTAIRGFAPGLGALASSFSITGDLIFIGKNKQDILLSWQRLKEIGGGIVVVHKGEVLVEVPLNLGGAMSDDTMENLIVKERELKECLKKFGYAFDDPANSLLFLSTIHLPYLRVTQQGLMDVKNKEILFPATMR
ncbi:adenine deaminase C-terminal domain-containing protein [Oceanobacillus saliphilus]|uniref:adenine deaminase C-terminal domain-containing protein n=1 Tax=Oceanobacillus saliphilus TaxID=2925834 RepID=UPI00201DE857|nr:adenine deaminase C-terminal domain-containing protein [Oceanobacillus saliphilus]